MKIIDRINKTGPFAVAGAAGGAFFGGFLGLNGSIVGALLGAVVCAWLGWRSTYGHTKEDRSGWTPPQPMPPRYHDNPSGDGKKPLVTRRMIEIANAQMTGKVSRPSKEVPQYSRKSKP